jgi:hypothetical protein
MDVRESDKMQNMKNFHNISISQIHDGGDSSSPLLGKFCGENFPNGGSLQSTHETLFLWFRSDHSTTGLGFEFNWNTTDPGTEILSLP